MWARYSQKFSIVLFNFYYFIYFYFIFYILKIKKVIFVLAQNSGKCRSNSTVVENPFTNTGRVAVDVLAGSTDNEAAIIDALYNVGPLVVLVNANCPAFTYYKSGMTLRKKKF